MRAIQRLAILSLAGCLGCSNDSAVHRHHHPPEKAMEQYNNALLTLYGDGDSLLVMANIEGPGKSATLRGPDTNDVFYLVELARKSDAGIPGGRLKIHLAGLKVKGSRIVPTSFDATLDPDTADKGAAGFKRSLADLDRKLKNPPAMDKRLAMIADIVLSVYRDQELEIAEVAVTSQGHTIGLAKKPHDILRLLRCFYGIGIDEPREPGERSKDLELTIELDGGKPDHRTFRFNSRDRLSFGPAASDAHYASLQESVLDLHLTGR